MQKRRGVLINKSGSINYNYIGLQALYERLGNDHPMKALIHSKVMSVKAGINGEAIIEGIFNKYTFPFEYNVLFDLNLSADGKFQIDALFISRHYILMLESKNIIGELSFEREPFCLRRKLESGHVDIFESPEVQLERNLNMLHRWLENRGIQIPLVGAIVLSSTKSEIIKPPENACIMYPSSIPNFIWKQSRKAAFLSTNQLEELSKSILKAHKDYYPYPMCKAWGIDSNDLIKGVRCEVCNRIGMRRVIRTWKCPHCLNQHKDAHILAIKEWFMLVGEEMTNSVCRSFLKIEKSQTATRLLQSMKLKTIGEGKGAKYKMSRKMLNGHKIIYPVIKNSMRS
ncbi:NERD domain-containing protein [Psychrobacillus sp. AK 1817]|nr:NERD domain-containing protein [Psychrobacillus sp. AK 1817]